MTNATPDELKHEARLLRLHGDSIGGSIQKDCWREAELLMAAAQELESEILMMKHKTCKRVNVNNGILTRFLCVSVPLAVLTVIRLVCVWTPVNKS